MIANGKRKTINGKWKKYFFLISLLFTVFRSPNAQAMEISHAVSTYGDVKYPALFRNFDYVDPNAPKGGEIVLPEIGSFDNLNPFILKGRAAVDTDLLFDTLMRGSDDETSTAYGLVAESAEMPEDNTYIIFNLRPEAKFSDGSGVTADDVVYSFNTLKKDGHPQYKILFAEIKSVVKLEKYKVRFEFSNSKTRELKLLIGGLPILSKTYYAKHEFNKTTLEAPLGSGPYKIERVDAGRAIVYKRRDDYWAKDLPVNKGRYNFDKIRHEYYLDVNVAIQAFKSGAVDLRYENIAKNWANSYNIPAVKDGRIIKVKLPNEIPSGMQCFTLNLRRDKFKDIRVRKALNLAMDFEWMNKNLFYGSYTRTNSYFANSIYASTGLPEGKELEILQQYRDELPVELFTREFKLPESDGNGRIRDRLLEAQKLLGEAGWHIRNGVLVSDKGEEFELEILLQQGSSFERIMGPFQRNLQILGIKSNLKSVDTSQYKELLDSFGYDSFVNTFAESLAPGTEQMSYWHSSSAETKGGMNYLGVKNPIVDKLVEAIIAAHDKETLIATTRALDRVLLWNYYVIPQWHIGSFRLLYWDKFGHPETLPKYDAGFGLMEWWVKKK